ncbi:MAG: transglycosylase SLT domain-containing protein [Gammaproteobacteria bacterium]|nr:transglycosylase SLT domain-containing protein [Gammaproteobacteria bacterium]
MRLWPLLAVGCTVFSLTACQSTPSIEGNVAAAAPDAANNAPPGNTITEPASASRPGATTNVDPAPENIWDRIASQLSWQSLDNPRIARERDWYLSQRGFMPLIASRAQYYLYHIVEEVEARDLPMELALLPLVESNLNPYASSSAHAVGLWQIMPATGKHLGLQQDWWYDGRRDVRASTRAALDYLEELYALCDEDWLLTLAAYNAGHGRVNRARRSNSKKGLPDDYWTIKLPRETRRYVPKLIALTQIVAAPARYGVNIPVVPDESPFEVATLGGQLEIARAAQLAEIDIGQLRALNPGQLRWATAPDLPAELLVPAGSAERLERALAELDDSERVRWEYYRIRPGDSLIRIARKFDTEVALLKEVNGITGSRIRAGKTLMIPSGGEWASSLALASNQQPARRQGYRVKRGDSLHRIAGRFNVSVREIVAWNALDPKKYLQPGQTLTLYVSDG